MKLSDQAVDQLQLHFAGPEGPRRLEATRLAMREKARASLWWLCRYALEFQDIETPLHVDMCDRWAVRCYKPFSMWLIPRGHLKTSLWTQGGTIWRLLRDPHQTFLITNAKHDKAIDILADIKQWFLKKEILRWLFPEYCIDLAPKHLSKLCRDVSYRLDLPCSRYAGQREGNIEVAGIESSVVSKHYHNLVYDDMVNDENVSTKNYRDKIWTNYRNALQLRISPKKSTVQVIGTRWHFDDAYARIIKAEMKRREQMRLEGKKVKPRYLMYVRADKEEVDGELQPIWPGRFSVEELRAIKEDIGSYLYSCNYQNNPLPENEAIFKYKDIQLIDELVIPDNVVSFASIDLAYEDTEQGDWTVITVASFDEKGKMYVREIYRDKIFPLELVETVSRLVARWHLVRVGIEETGFQNTIYKFYKQETQRTGVNIPWTQIKRATRTSKKKRILALQPRVERKDFFVQADIKNLEWLVEEMTTFDKGAHDDILDTLADIEAMFYRAPALFTEQIEKIPSLDNLYGRLEETDDDVDEPEVPNFELIIGD